MRILIPGVYACAYYSYVNKNTALLFGEAGNPHGLYFLRESECVNVLTYITVDVEFHAQQEGQLCAQHCLNNLLQGTYSDIAIILCIHL